MRQCRGCVFRDCKNVCEIKNISVYDVFYDNCWFYKDTLEESDESEDEY